MTSTGIGEATAISSQELRRAVSGSGSIGVIGAGIGGLHLALFLQQHGVPVTLYAERTPDEQRAGRLPNTAAHWRRTRERERELGVNHWDDIAERWAINHMHVTVTVRPPLKFTADLEVGGICVDQRMYTARLLEDYIDRGGHVVFGRVQLESLELLAQIHDLMVVSSGRGSMTELFERVQTPFPQPQRFLCTGIYHGVTPREPVGLGLNVAPGTGELFELPYITFGGQAVALFFEVVPGGSLDPLMHVRYEDDPAKFERTVLEVLEQTFPETRARIDAANFGVTRPQDILQGAITPTTRRGYARLDNGKYVLAVGDIHMVNDPVMGQGANSASHSAFVAGQAILDDNLAFDEIWCQRTEARILDYSESVFRWNNHMLRVPLPMNVVEFLMAAGRDKRIANEFGANFAEPERNWNILASPARTTAFLRRAGHAPAAAPGAPPANNGQADSVAAAQAAASITTEGAPSMSTAQLDDRVSQLAAAPRKMLIGADWVSAGSGATIDLLNPATGELLARAPAADRDDVDRAVRAARAAFTGEWAKTSPSDRGKLLWRLGDLIDANLGEIAELDALDNGMPVGVASAFAMLAAETCRYFAGWATKVQGTTLGLSVPYTPGAEYHAYTLREPVGVVGAIIPWNYPALAAAWKIAPALATGNTIVLKPAEQALLSVLRIGELALEAGIPAGVVNMVTGYGEVAGAALAAHPGVDKITFTGSNETGKLIVKAAAETNLKKVSLELGGKSPNIVFADADIDGAIAGAANAIFFNQGQNCAAGSRLYVERSVFDRVVGGISEAAKQIKVGAGTDPTTELGPLVSQEQLDRVLGYLRDGHSAGARAVVGGQRLQGNGYGGGYFIQPTVLVDATPSMKVVREEIFGPVVAAIPFDDPEEIVPIANDSIFGLVAGVWTRDVSKAHKVAAQLKAGTVWINTYNVFDAAMPFGGYKQSGWGRELGQEAIHDFTQNKSVCVGL